MAASPREWPQVAAFSIFNLHLSDIFIKALLHLQQQITTLSVLLARFFFWCNLTGGISVRICFGWQSGVQDLWEFVYEFMIQLCLGWILKPNIGIMFHDSVLCFDDCFGPRRMQRLHPDSTAPFVCCYIKCFSVALSAKQTEGIFMHFWNLCIFEPLRRDLEHCTFLSLLFESLFADHSILALEHDTWLDRSSLSVASLVAIQGFTLALGLFGTSAVNLLLHRIPTTNVIFFGESNRPGARSLLLRMGSYLAVAYMLPVHQTSLKNSEI